MKLNRKDGFILELAFASYFCKKKLDSFNTIIIVGVVLILILFIAYGLFSKNKNPEMPVAVNTQSQQMQMLAYERLTILVDRIALPNLISRVNQAGISAREMQLLLTQNIKEEFAHNITQQLYVSPDAWNAVKNLKEQNLLIINQYANTLPQQATGLDLNKKLLEYLMQNKKGALHEVVNEVLNFEMKKALIN